MAVSGGAALRVTTPAVRNNSLDIQAENPVGGSTVFSRELPATTSEPTTIRDSAAGRELQQTLQKRLATRAPDVQDIRRQTGVQARLSRFGVKTWYVKDAKPKLRTLGAQREKEMAIAGRQPDEKAAEEIRDYLKQEFRKRYSNYSERRLKAIDDYVDKNWARVHWKAAGKGKPGFVYPANGLLPTDLEAGGQKGVLITQDSGGHGYLFQKMLVDWQRQALPRWNKKENLLHKGPLATTLVGTHLTAENPKTLAIGKMTPNRMHQDPKKTEDEDLSAVRRKVARFRQETEWERKIRAALGGESSTGFDIGSFFSDDGEFGAKFEHFARFGDLAGISKALRAKRKHFRPDVDFDCLNTPEKILYDKILRTLMKQLTQEIWNAHQKEIYFGDIKPHNALADDRVKNIDLGGAARKVGNQLRFFTERDDKGNEKPHFAITRGYADPRIVDGGLTPMKVLKNKGEKKAEQLLKENDLHALSGLYYAMIYGRVPDKHRDVSSDPFVARNLGRIAKKRYKDVGEILQEPYFVEGEVFSDEELPAALEALLNPKKRELNKNERLS